MTTKTHSPTPWGQQGREIRSDVYPDKGVLAIIPLPQTGGVFEAQENGRRIVAAVNALSGIPTEAIEQGVVRELIEAAGFAAEAGKSNTARSIMDRAKARKMLRFVLAKIEGREP